jgi:hypothetical protein
MTTTDPSPPTELLPGLWRWTARHPEWHPGEFGKDVAAFAVKAGEDLLLIDPLLPSEPDRVHELIESQLGGRLAILITIPYHVRSSEELWKRYRRDAETAIWGHPRLARRLEDDSGFVPMDPETDLPGGVTAHAIGKPRRFELPLHLPSHDALAFGDAIAEVGDGDLRMWSNEPVDDHWRAWYRDAFAPTLEPLLDLDFEHVLVTHGEPVLGAGREGLREALRRPPWRQPD